MAIEEPSLVAKPLALAPVRHAAEDRRFQLFVPFVLFANHLPTLK
jgi:hypothetical protein